MADNKKYYYLKLKDNFFDSDEMVVLESMPDGYIYSNILLKLYLRSLKSEGRLMFNDRIPFNSTMLANVTRHSVGDVEKAISIFTELNLVEIMDNGAIYMTDIQSFIGKSSTEADRKRIYRQKIDQEKSNLVTDGQMSDKCPDKSTPELEIETDIELEKEKKKESNKKDNVKQSFPSAEYFEEIWKSYPKKTQKKKAKEQFVKKIKSDTDLETFKQGFNAYLKYIEINDWYHPQELFRWIRDERYNDEYDLTPPKAQGFQKQPVRQETIPELVANPIAERKLSKEKQAKIQAELDELLNI